MFPQTTITFEAAMRDLGSNTAKTRAQAALALGDVTEKAERDAATDALIDRLTDPVAEVRSSALSSLGELGGERMVSAVASLLDDPAIGTRQAAAIALGMSKSPRAFAPLAEALASGPPDVRFQAATSLVEVDPVRAVTPLVSALSDDDPEVRSAVALALGNTRDERAQGPLIERLSQETGSLAFDVAYALAQLGDDSGAATLAEYTTCRERCWDAIEGLDMARAKSAEPALAALLGRRGPRELRVRAAAALLSLAPDGRYASSAQSELVAALSAWKHHLRALAVEQLARVGGPWAERPLESLARSRRGRWLRDEINIALRAISKHSESVLRPAL